MTGAIVWAVYLAVATVLAWGVVLHVQHCPEDRTRLQRHRRKPAVFAFMALACLLWPASVAWYLIDYVGSEDDR